MFGRWFGKPGRSPGWLAMTFAPEQVSYVHAVPGGAGKASIARLGVESGGPGQRQKFARELDAQRHRCTTLLKPDEYQFLLLEAPNVPEPELKGAVRWKVKDLIDYRVDDATIDVLPIPAEGAGSAQRAGSVFAVAAKNEIVSGCMRSFDEAGVPLAVIDIPETAQRNIAALYEQGERGLALLYLDRDYGQLTVSCKGELYLARRMEIGFDALRRASGDARESLFTRVVVELQRTFDHFERQFRSITISEMLLGPLPEETGLARTLADNIGIDVQAIDLAQRIAFPRGAEPDLAAQWSLFHLIGASLRQESGG